MSRALVLVVEGTSDEALIVRAFRKHDSATDVVVVHDGEEEATFSKIAGEKARP